MKPGTRLIGWWFYALLACRKVYTNQFFLDSLNFPKSPKKTGNASGESELQWTWVYYQLIALLCQLFAKRATTVERGPAEDCRVQTNSVALTSQRWRGQPAVRIQWGPGHGMDHWLNSGQCTWYSVQCKVESVQWMYCIQSTVYRGCTMYSGCTVYSVYTVYNVQWVYKVQCTVGHGYTVSAQCLFAVQCTAYSG